MTFTIGDDVQVISEFVVTEDHEGAPGLAHGGLLTAALDETQATLLWVLRMPAVTARLETDFLAPVPVGSIVRIEARCLGLADRKIFTSAQGLLVPARRQHGRARDPVVSIVRHGARRTFHCVRPRRSRRSLD